MPAANKFNCCQARQYVVSLRRFFEPNVSPSARICGLAPAERARSPKSSAVHGLRARSWKPLLAAKATALQSLNSVTVSLELSIFAAPHGES